MATKKTSTSAPPLYIQEKMQPKVLVDDLQQQTRARRDGATGGMVDMFSDFNGILAGADKTGFYARDQNWARGGFAGKARPDAILRRSFRALGAA